MKTKSKKINYYFKGWDFSELAIKWQIYIPDDAGLYENMEDWQYIELYLQHFTRFVWHKNKNNMSRVSKVIANDIRNFCRQLSRCSHTYDSGVWKAISEIKDDYSCIRIFIPLVGYAWS